MQFDKLAAITGGTLYNTAAASKYFTGVTIDSRKVDDGALYVAIRGDRNDGHEFIDSAIKSGAVGIIANANYNRLPHIDGRIPVVAVEDTHRALLSLARAWRQNLSARFVAITGSNGKTTTKEFTHQLIRAVDDHCFRSPGNLNNLYGVPLSLFAIPPETSLAVMELGISTDIEMPRLTKLVDPDLIVITNVGPTHLETLGTVENVARAKLRLAADANPKSPLILNADDPILIEQAQVVRSDFITFGLNSPDADFRPEQHHTDKHGVSHITIEGHEFYLNLPGRFQIYNLLAAYATFRTLGLSFDGVDTGAIEFATASMRGETVRRSAIDFVVDCYNANPGSMKIGLESFLERKTSSRKVIILGDMLELGPNARRFHFETGQSLVKNEFDLAICVGKLSEEIVAGATAAGIPFGQLHWFENTQKAAMEIADLLHEGDLVYLKGSRGIGLEKLLDSFEGEDA